MAAINEAWRVLSDPQARAAYDRVYDRTVDTPPPTPPPRPPPPPPAERADRVVDLDDLSDEPLTHSERWTRRWLIGVGFLLALAAAFGALLMWIALGGGT